jgi:hypothetical protein
MNGEQQQNLVICDSKYAALVYTFIASCNVQDGLSIRYVRDLLRYTIPLKKTSWNTAWQFESFQSRYNTK